MYDVRIVLADEKGQHFRQEKGQFPEFVEAVATARQELDLEKYLAGDIKMDGKEPVSAQVLRGDEVVWEQTVVQRGQERLEQHLASWD